MKSVVILLLCIALPAVAAEWGRLFYSQQERAAMTIASMPAVSVMHVLSAQTIADGHIRHWVDAASQPVISVPAHVRVGDEWQEGP